MNMADQEPKPGLPRQGRLAGVDYGTVRIGIAISDADQTIASPLENYNRRNSRLDGQFFVTLAEQERIVGWVVGLPVHLSGEESQKSSEARAYGKWLQELTGLPVVFYDERFTSAIAEEYLLDANLTKKKRKQRMDKLAAQILLAGFLESSRSSEHSESLDDSSE